MLLNQLIYEQKLLLLQKYHCATKYIILKHIIHMQAKKIDEWFNTN